VLGDFNAKVGKEDVFKPTIVNEGLHEICYDKGFKQYTLRIQKSHSEKHIVLTSQYSLIYLGFPDGRTQNYMENCLIDKQRHSSVDE
jgi:hypothetical protein